MRVLIACEYSGIVRNAFAIAGHDATSCDFLDTEIPGKHYKGNVFDIINDGWDMMIAFPPCTYLTVAANRSYLNNPPRWEERLKAVKFVHKLLNAPIEKIVLENPVGAISTWIRKPDQIIQPYEYGHPMSKKTCLWLKGLPLLKPTKIVEPEWIRDKTAGKRYSPLHYKTFCTADAWKIRSKTFPGIAKAMADQWG